MAKNKEKQEKTVQPENTGLEALLPKTDKDTTPMPNVVPAPSDAMYENADIVLCPNCGGNKSRPAGKPEQYQFRSITKMKQLYRCGCCQKVFYHTWEKDV
jgi:hypothetical protein